MSSLSNSKRRSPLAEVRALVVKVGTSTLTDSRGELDTSYLADLARQCAVLRAEKVRTAIVSSGAIRVGARALGIAAPRTLPQKQAAAAVGQGLLMRAYQDIFARHRLQAAQVLLTRDDVADRQRFLNARNTLRTLFDLGAVPIVNENDTVAVDEIRFGDNDTLASLVAIVAECDAVVLLSDVDGFSPASTRNEVLPCVEALTPDLLAAAGGSDARRGGGTGGMVTKLEAARVAMHSGLPLVIANGRERDVLLRLIGGEEIGTVFVPRRGLNARKRWIAFAGKPRGALVVNDGAKRSLLEQGKSLLPIGVIRVRGRFEQGDLVALVDAREIGFARGLVNYDARAAERIAGLRSGQIVRTLGRKDYDEIVHRDNLVITEHRNEP